MPEFKCLSLSNLKLWIRTMRVWLSQRFVVHSLLRPWPPLWMTSWMHHHSRISVIQNSIFIFEIALMSSLSPEWKWGSWVAVRDRNFQWIVKILWHWQLCKSNNIFEFSLCFAAGIFKQIFFFILHLIWSHHSELLLLSRRVLAEAIMAWI